MIMYMHYKQITNEILLFKTHHQQEVQSGKLNWIFIIP